MTDPNHDGGRFSPRGLSRSLAGKLTLLIAVFAAVPAILYGQFRAADEHKQTLLLRSVQDQGRIIANALQPLLETGEPSPIPAIGRELERLAAGRTEVKLLLRPADEAGGESFYYVAASPSVPTADLDTERERLRAQGVLGRLAETCEGNLPLAVRYVTASGREQVVTSITPVLTDLGCWAVVTSHSTGDFLDSSLGQPYWKTPEVKLAAAIYVGMALLVLVIFAGVWRNLARFAGLARDIRRGRDEGASFARQNTVPELEGVARAFDRMVATLQRSAESIRRAAEDNAHAFKTPIAVIRQSVEPLKRVVPESDARGRKAIEMIESSTERLDGLVAFARRMDEATADFIDPPQEEVDLSALLKHMADGYAELLEHRGLRLSARIEDGAVVRAGDELLETVIENVIDNAASFSPERGEIGVELACRDGLAELTVSDDGPGVPEAELPRIFERYVSNRPNRPGDAAGHFGIGLWIVRRNVEAVGGTVEAENREAGGLSVRLRLPLAA